MSASSLASAAEQHFADHPAPQSVADVHGIAGLFDVGKNIVQSVLAAAKKQAQTPEVIAAAESAVDELWLKYVVPVNWPLPDAIEASVEQSLLNAAKAVIRSTLTPAS